MRRLAKIILYTGLLIIAERAECGAMASHPAAIETVMPEGQKHHQDFEAVHQAAQSYIKKHQVSKGEKIRRAFKRFADKVRDAFEEAGDAIVSVFQHAVPTDEDKIDAAFEKAVRDIARRTPLGKNADDLFDTFKKSL